MLRSVAWVSALICASHSALPHQLAITKPGRPSIAAVNSSHVDASLVCSAERARALEQVALNLCEQALDRVDESIHRQQRRLHARIATRREDRALLDVLRSDLKTQRHTAHLVLGELPQPGEFVSSASSFTRNPAASRSALIFSQVGNTVVFQSPRGMGTITT